MRWIWITIATFAVLVSSGTAPAGRPGRARIEINLGGYENTGPRPGIDYNLPSAATLQYFVRKGITTVRLPMYWNRLQPTAFGPLDPAKVDELAAFLDLADRSGVKVIADLHGFGGRDGQLLGSPELPIGALASFWGPFAARFANRLHGYDLMNEPHDMPSPEAWPSAAQAAVDEIRKHDRRTHIYVEGDDWSNAERWTSTNDDLNIRDPSNRIIYSAHIYFDADTSGQYRKGYAADGADPAIGVRRIAPFVAWLRAHKFRGHIGEFGVPHDDPRWIAVLDGFTGAVRDNRDVLTGASYFAAGDWMDWYPLTLQPDATFRIDRPQLKVLTRSRP